MWFASFFSGTQLRETLVTASAPPPISIRTPHALSGNSGCDDSARDVATTGPTTPAADIIAVSTA